jgi:hypothetical protein
MNTIKKAAALWEDNRLCIRLWIYPNLDRSSRVAIIAVKQIAEIEE